MTRSRKLQFHRLPNPDPGFKSRYRVLDEDGNTLGSVQQAMSDSRWALWAPSAQIFERGCLRRFDAAQVLYAERHGWDAAEELGRS